MHLFSSFFFVPLWLWEIFIFHFWWKWFIKNWVTFNTPKVSGIITLLVLIEPYLLSSECIFLNYINHQMKFYQIYIFISITNYWEGYLANHFMLWWVICPVAPLTGLPGHPLCRFLLLLLWFFVMSCAHAHHAPLCPYLGFIIVCIKCSA